MKCGIDVQRKWYGANRKSNRGRMEIIKQYRNLCEENKLTINILIQRLLAHEKGRE